MKRAELFEIAFALGFLASREGFNGECAYDNCAPGSIFQAPSAHHESLEVALHDMQEDGEFNRLRREAREIIVELDGG